MSKNTASAPKAPSNAKAFVNPPSDMAEGVSGEYKAGPVSPRDMGKTRNQVAYANGGMYQAGKPAARNGGKSGAPC